MSNTRKSMILLGNAVRDNLAPLPLPISQDRYSIVPISGECAVNSCSGDVYGDSVSVTVRRKRYRLFFCFYHRSEEVEGKESFLRGEW